MLDLELDINDIEVNIFFKPIRGECERVWVQKVMLNPLNNTNQRKNVVSQQSLLTVQ